MASEPDDNPFIRNSVWPKMPQAPFRVGSLPNAAGGPPLPLEGEPQAEPEPAPRTITPLFVRPLDAGLPGGLTISGALPQSGFRSAPMPEPFAEPQPVAQPEPVAGPEPRAVPIEPAAEAEPELPPFELSEVVATPIRRPPPQRSRPKPRRRSPAPAIAASVVGLGAAGGAVFLLTRAPPSPTHSAATVTIPIAPPAPVAASLAPPLTGPPPVELAAALPPAKVVAPAAPRARAAPVPRVVAPRTLAPRPVTPLGRLPSDAAVATDEAINGPALVLSPAAAAQPAPELPYRPPVAADPGAPIRTQRRY